MKIAGVAALLLVSPIVAQADAGEAPYKLVMVINGTATAVIDYPNRERCYDAQVAAYRAADDENSEEAMSDSEVLRNGLMRRPPVSLVAFCIPA